jgi:hypothetical protein
MLGLLSSSVVQAVLTEDIIIDKELTWAAMARKKTPRRLSLEGSRRKGIY